MITRKRTIFLFLICILTVGFASVYAAGSNPFDILYDDFNAFQASVFTTFEQMLASINVLETDVAVIEGQLGILALTNYIDTLEARIDALEVGGNNPGTPGPEGPPGPAGPKGDPGNTGAAGLKGEQGIIGEQGPKGDTGDTGQMGPAGPAGPMGSQGDTGYTGLQGIQGLKGDTGDIGPPGLGFGVLIHDSGWIAIDQGEITICTLANRNVFVYMTGINHLNEIHQIAYGGLFYYTPEEGRRGAHWKITNSNELKFARYRDDSYWLKVRVMVWQLPA